MTYTSKYKKLIIYRRILVVILIAFMVIVSFFNSMLRKNSLEMMHHQLKTETQVLSGIINEHLVKNEEIVKQLSENTHLVDQIRNLEMQPDEIEFIMTSLSDANSSNSADGFAWIGVNVLNKIIYPDGYADLASDYVYSQRPWYKIMMENPDRVSITEPYIEVADYTEVVTMVKPIYDGDEIIGNVGLDLNLDELKSYVATFKIGSNGQVALVTEDRHVISHSLDLVITENHPFKSMNYQMEKVQEVIIDGKQAFLYYSPTSVEGWYICAYLPISELNTQITYISIMSGVLLMIAMVLLMLYSTVMKLQNDNKTLIEMNEKLEKQDESLKEKHAEIEETNTQLYNKNLELEAAYQQLTAFDEEIQAQLADKEAYAAELEDIKYKFEMAVQFTESSVWEFDIEKQSLSITLGFRDNVSNDLKEDDNDLVTIDEMIYPEDRMKFWQALQKHSKGETDTLHEEVRLYDEEGLLSWWLVHGKKHEDKPIIIGTIVNITKLKNQEEVVQKMTTIDPLTRLPNRSQFESVLEEAIRNNEKGLIALIDLDNFKEINDTLGHIYGDHILRIISNRLYGLANDHLFVSRFGGDEFLILINDQNQVDDILKNIKQIIGEKILVDNHEHFISTSIGLTKYPDDGKTSEQLFMNADVAMYHVKKSGKNNYAYFDETMRAEVYEKTNIEKVIDKALENDGFRLVLQPIINPSTGYVTASEALIRLKHSELGPSRFIPVAETSHRIIDIGRWVLQEAVKMIYTWQKEGRHVMPISINFSPKQLLDRHFISYYQSLLDKYHVSAEMIRFEITESILLGQEAVSVEFIEALRNLGSPILLDDFGTGYSSLSYLTYLPVDYIKLDKSLCDKFLNMKDRNVIKSVVTLAHGLNLKVVAEGIESFMQVELLLRMDCDYIQGYYYSKPLSIEEFNKISGQKFD
ncbi:EAL domain-containing protein [Acidaminobacter sp. JC074]|uniref:EAL domain-containing protein n=1 Tax=Acidaminobacter sp. JC074 TaxID=2530199 RepID=UPI001F0F3C39|nr:EAL domain-containing protein [Acidaminobacter sp. JC074]MCH4887569.1 EAL domain-containing protein [Acidaminobacter sp. JC074]